MFFKDAMRLYYHNFISIHPDVWLPTVKHIKQYQYLVPWTKEYRLNELFELTGAHADQQGHV